MLNNLFVKLNIYTLNADIVLNNDSLPHAQKIGEILNTTGILERIYQVLRFDYTPQMAGATWFLYALAFICVFHCGFGYLLVRIHSRIVRDLIKNVIIVIVAMLAWDTSTGFGSINTIMEGRHSRLFACYLIFLVGIELKKVQNNRKVQIFGVWQGTVAVIILFFLSRFGTLELSKGEIVNPVFYIISSLSGWVFLGSLSRLIVAWRADKPFLYIGNNTMQVMIFHLLSFKVVSWIYVFINSRPYYQIATFPVIFDTGESLKIVYTIVGVCLSFLIYALIRRVADKMIAFVVELRMKKKYTMIILLAITLCFCILFGPDIGREERIVTTFEYPKTGNIGQIVAGKEIEQRIDTQSGKLHAFRLYIATYNRVNDCELSVSIMKEEETFNTWIINCLDLPDNTYQVFNLDTPIKIEQGMKIVVRSNGTSGNAVTIYKSDQNGSDGLRMDSSEIQGESLCYRLDMIEKNGVTILEYCLRLLFAGVLLMVIYFVSAFKDSDYLIFE